MQKRPQRIIRANGDEIRLRKSIVFNGKKMITFNDGRSTASITEFDHKCGVLPSEKLVMLTMRRRSRPCAPCLPPRYAALDARPQGLQCPSAYLSVAPHLMHGFISRLAAVPITAPCNQRAAQTLPKSRIPICGRYRADFVPRRFRGCECRNTCRAFRSALYAVRLHPLVPTDAHQ